MTNDPTVLRLSAFTMDGAGGNPAGVVLDAAGLGEERMLAIAAEVGYSETVFVTGPADSAGVPVRYFSPEAEVPFCGHATLALAVALADRDGVGTIALDTPVGRIVVETSREQDAAAADGAAAPTRATLTSVPTSVRPPTAEERVRLLSALRLDEGDLDATLPLLVGFAGNEHPIVAVSSRERLAALDYDFDALRALMAERGWPATVDVVWRECPDVFHARNPFPPGGVVEDSATGSAALALGGYLAAIGAASAGDRITIVQGEDQGSPSELLLDVPEPGGRARVSGTASPIRSTIPSARPSAPSSAEREVDAPKPGEPSPAGGRAAEGA